MKSLFDSRTNWRPILLSMLAIAFTLSGYSLLKSKILLSPDKLDHSFIITLTLTTILGVSNFALIRVFENRQINNYYFWRALFTELSAHIAITSLIVYVVTVCLYHAGIGTNYTIQAAFFNNWSLSLILVILIVTATKSARFFNWWKELIVTAEQLKRENLLSRFEILRNQVNPHFLFNSFNTLSALIDEDKELSQQYITNLSDYFRILLQYRDVELIPLSEELRLVNNYFALQAPRYGNNLVFNQRVPHENLISNIPPMALQILAENAIKHNIISSVKPLYFSITVYQSYIVVSNNIQKKKQSEPSSGLGLQNIKSRYALVTGIPVEIEETTNNFTVKLPLLT